jgi:hypothetical protein
MLAQRAGMRLGGGYDAITGSGYGSAGLSAIAEIGALDIGIRYDLTQGELAPGVRYPRTTVAGVGLRLFVPAMQTRPQ